MPTFTIIFKDHIQVIRRVISFKNVKKLQFGDGLRFHLEHTLKNTDRKKAH